MEWLTQILDKLDPLTAIITAITAIFIVMRKRIVQKLKDWTIYFTEGVLYHVGHMVKLAIAASLSLKKYCRIQLGIETYKYLRVPSREDFSIDIDRIFVPLALRRPKVVFSGQFS